MGAPERLPLLLPPPEPTPAEQYERDAIAAAQSDAMEDEPAEDLG